MARACASSVTSVSRTRTSAADPVGQRLEPVASTGGDGHRGAGPGQGDRRGLTDAAGCAGDQGHRSVESLRHGRVPCRLGGAGHRWARRQRRSVPRRPPGTAGGRTAPGTGSAGRSAAAVAQAALRCELRRPARVAPAAAGTDRGVVGATGGCRALVEGAPVGAVVPGEVDLARRFDAHPSGPVRDGRGGAGQPLRQHGSVLDRSAVPPSLRSPCSHAGDGAGDVTSLWAPGGSPILHGASAGGRQN